MIRARSSNGDFIFGLDAENIRRLTAGKPIVVDLAKMGGQGRVLITYGETLDDVMRDLQEATGQTLRPQ